MDGNQTPIIKCDVDFTLMGMLNYNELLSLYDLSVSHLLQQGWRVDWYENVQSIVLDKQKTLSSIAPNEFYEKLYNVVDLGLFHFEYTDEEKRTKKISIYIHDSILPSYQIRTSITLYFTSSENILQNIWKQIKTTNSLVSNIAKAADLTPTIDTWTICFTSIEKETHNKINLIDNTTDLRSSLFGDESIVVESASVIEESLRVLKLLGQGCEQYLIISFDTGDEIAISRLYYLMLAKGYGGPRCQDTKTGSNKSYFPPFRLLSVLNGLRSCLVKNTLRQEYGNQVPGEGAPDYKT